ncbi:hypothetical protein [Streptodolium elevatio]|uniref:Peptidase inhibitor family I36 n=1 Tax=Streptodolium elevatio TaxID=3157996 RepID=A0ABV3DG06_9ACTN
MRTATTADSTANGTTAHETIGARTTPMRTSAIRADAARTTTARARGAVRRISGALAALALAAAALVAGPGSAAAASGEGAPADGRVQKSGLCPEGYVCLFPGGIAAPEPYLIPECGSEYFRSPYITSSVENRTNAIVWVTTADGAATWIPPHGSLTLWPVAPVDSVVSQCFVPLPF